MTTTANPTPSPAAASAQAPGSRTLELREARQLRDSLEVLLRKEQWAMADFLVALADFDRRRGWEPLGHASFFAFLHFELGLSNSAAFYRMSAARLLQRFPDLVEPIRDGRLWLSTTAELAKVVTEGNRSVVAPRFFGRSAREAQEIVSELQPRAAPPLHAVVTSMARSLACIEPPLAAPLRGPATWPEQASCSPSPAPADTDSGSLLTSEEELTHPARAAAPRDAVEPLTADLRRLHVTVSREFLRELEVAREGLSHVIPSATTEQVLQAAIRLLLEKQARARGLVKRPRAALTTRPSTTASSAANEGGSECEPIHRRPGPRQAIPAAVRRAVWERDQGRCSWPVDGGGCCGSTHQVELDHIVPWAAGGESTAANLRLTCHHHNALAAKAAFGKRCVGRYAGARRRG